MAAVAMTIACPTCSQLICTDSLCRHRHPICDGCCGNNETHPCGCCGGWPEEAA